MASELKVNKITPESGVTLTLGDSGDTINFGSGVLPNFENLTVTGDLTVDTNSLKVDSTNNFVGIGTASPTVALDVVGAITATGNITGTLATAAQPNITSLGTLTGLTTAGNINFGDNDKAVFGAGSDLQIFHDGSVSKIADSGVGNFDLQTNGTSIRLMSNNGTETMALFNQNSSVDLYYDNAQKLATTSTGIDVTGTVVSDGLTVDTTADNGATISAHDNSTTTYPLKVQNAAGTGRLEIGTYGINNNIDLKFQTQDILRMRIDDSLGDVMFYEDTGTTPKFFWDASAERLGIGTTTPNELLEVRGNVRIGGGTADTADMILKANTGPAIPVGGSSEAAIITTAGQAGGAFHVGVEVPSNDTNDGFYVATDSNQDGTVDTLAMKIIANGNVGIGTSSPTQKLDVNGTVKATAFQGDGSALTGIGGTNTPAFLVTKTSNQNLSDAATTKVTFDSVVFDTDSDVDIVTNNRFTPSVAGKYYIYASIGLYAGTGNNYRTGTYRIRKNGSDLIFNQFNPEPNFTRNLTHYIGITAEANGTTDYFEVFAQLDVSSGTPFVNGSSTNTYFGGYKIIE